MSAAPALKILTYVAVLMAAAVGADRLLAQRLYAEPDRLVPAYRTFNEPSEGVKLKQLSDTDVRLDTLVLGNSRALSAVDPELLDRSLAELGVQTESFNLALPTIDVRFWPPFFERYYDRAPPRNVLLGVIPRDIDARNTIAEVQGQAFRSSPGFANRDRSRVWREAEEALADLYTLRGRGNELRRAGPSALLHGDTIDRPGFRPRGDRGGAVFDPSLVLTPGELAANARRLADRSGPRRLRVGAEQIAALEKLDRLVRAGGGCLTLFTTPLLYDREEYGNVEVIRAFQRTLRQFAREHPTVGFLDVGARVQAGYDLRDFADGDHLSAAGARRFTPELAQAVAPRLDRPCGT